MRLSPKKRLRKMAKDNLENTKKLMAALMKMPPKPHSKLKQKRKPMPQAKGAKSQNPVKRA